MGNSPLTVCISQAFERRTVQVVLADGQVLFMPHPLTAGMLMEAHPSHIVCHGCPSLLEAQRLPTHQRLESGEVYYLLPSSAPSVPTTPTRDLLQNIKQQQSKVKQFKQTRAPYKPPPADFPDYAKLSLKPQRCLINLFVFRQSVASIMPEESFKGVTQSQSQGDPYQQYGNKLRAAVSAPSAVPSAPSSAPLLANNKRNPPQLDHHAQKQQTRGTRGRKSVAPWRPYLESISETKPVLHDFSPSLPIIPNKCDHNIYINNFSVPMITGVKALSPAPSPPGSPLNNLVLPLHSYGPRHCQQQFTHDHQLLRLTGLTHLGGLMHSPLPSPLASPRAGGDRDNQRQRFIYSA